MSHRLPVILVGNLGDGFQGADVDLGGFGGGKVILLLEQVSNQLELEGKRWNMGLNWAQVIQTGSGSGSHLAGLQDVDLLLIDGVSVLLQEAFTLILHLQDPTNQDKDERRKNLQTSELWTEVCYVTIAKKMFCKRKLDKNAI